MNKRLVPMPTTLDRAYRDAHTAMMACLEEGTVDAGGLKTMQNAMKNLEPNRRAFGLDRYHELKVLLEEVEKLPVSEPVFVEHEPMFGYEHQRRMKPYRRVPYPYQFHWDAGWIFVGLLFLGSYEYPALIVPAGLIAFLRIVTWCSFRFPLSTVAVISLFLGMFGGGRRGRW